MDGVRECEEWRIIPDRPDYEASTQGRIRLRVASRLHPAGFVLTSRIDSTGYPSVALVGHTRERVHALMRSAFFGVKVAGHEMNHIDGDKTNNRLVNLEYVTAAENRRHAFKSGLNRVGELHGQSKLNPEKVRLIRSSNKSNYQLAAELGVGEATIRSARKGETWAHVS